jgi:uncharacterized protein YdgA (DUF945 family)
MKRAGIGALVAMIVMAALFVLLPGIIGYTAESRVTGWLRAISQQGGYRIELVDFHRGWFRSTAKSRLIMEGQYAETVQQLLGAEPGTRIALTFDHVIHHGPLMFGDGLPKVGAAHAETEMHLPAMLEAMLSPYLDGQPLVTFRTTFGLAGGSTTLISNPEYSGTLGPHSAVQWNGASGRIETSSNAFSVGVSMPLFRFEADQRLFLIRDMSVKSNQTRRGKHLWIGNTNATVKEIALASPDSGESARVGGLAYRVSVSPNGPKRLDMNAVFGLQSGEFEGGSLGPSAWTLSVHNLSAQALDDAYDLFDRFRDTDEPDERRAILDTFLNQSLDNLFDSPVRLETGLSTEIEGPFAVYKGATTLGLQGERGDVTLTLDQKIDRLRYDTVALNEASGRLRIEALDGDILGDIYADFVRIIATGMPEQQQEVEMEAVFAQKAPAIIRPDTALHLEDVQLKSPDGEASAHGNLGFRGAQPLEFHQMDSVVDRLEGRLHVRLSRGTLVAYLAEQSAAELRQRLGRQGRNVSEEMVQRLARTSAITQLGTLEEQALVVADGDDYVIDAALARGRVVLNGVDRPDLAP